jgi:DNA repair protein RadC
METVRNSLDAIRLFYPVIYDLDHEEAWVIFLTACNKVISMEMLSKGTLTQTSIDSRTILRLALLHNASSIILCHNHPSGNEQPSRADIGLTDNLRKACKLIDILLIDHIIVGQNRYYSFAEDGAFPVRK